MVFFSEKTGVPLWEKQQVKQSNEAEQQADEEQLSEGRRQEPRKKQGRQAEMPWGWEKARKADPANR